MAAPIPMPHDFREHAHLTNEELCARYGYHHHKTWAKWRSRVSVRIVATRRPAKLPADWSSFAPGKTIGVLAHHYGVNKKVIGRWRRETGVTGFKPERQKKAAKVRIVPVPDGFAKLAPTLLLVDLCERYGRSRKTIHRWLSETGTAPKPYRDTARVPKPPCVTPIRGRFILPGASMSAAVPGPKSGREEEAAQYLRRFAAVYRCGPRGGADSVGEFWRYGHAVLTPAELDAKARRLGWDPDEWRVIAGQSIRRDALPAFPRTGAV